MLFGCQSLSKNTDDPTKLQKKKDENRRFVQMTILSDSIEHFFALNNFFFIQFLLIQ